MNLKTRVQQLEKANMPSFPLIVLEDGDLSPERLKEIEAAEAAGRNVIRISFIDAAL